MTTEIYDHALKRFSLPFPKYMALWKSFFAVRPLSMLEEVLRLSDLALATKRKELLVQYYQYATLFWILTMLYVGAILFICSLGWIGVLTAVCLGGYLYLGRKKDLLFRLYKKRTFLALMLSSLAPVRETEVIDEVLRGRDSSIHKKRGTVLSYEAAYRIHTARNREEEG